MIDRGEALGRFLRARALQAPGQALAGAHGLAGVPGQALAGIDPVAALKAIAGLMAPPSQTQTFQQTVKNRNVPPYDMLWQAYLRGAKNPAMRYPGQ